MREFTTPSDREAPAAGSLADDVVSHATEDPDGVLFRRRTADGWRDVSAAKFRRHVEDLARGLIASGVEPGDRVAILSRTRYEWATADYAAWTAGAVSVPLYPTSSPEQMAEILRDSGATTAFTEGPEQMARLDLAKAAGAPLREAWPFEDLPHLRGAGAAVSDHQLQERRDGLTPDSVATVVYTSGTTGTPRGCVLTHGNFMAEVDAALSALPEIFHADDAATLLFLPLPHIFARIVQVGAVKARIPLAHSPDARTLFEDLQATRPTFLLAVPGVLERMFNTISQNAAADGRGRAFDRAAETAIAFSRAQDAGGAGLLLRTRHRLLDSRAYAGLRDALGGRCRHVISGGAPLSERLAHFYRGVGIPVLEGYGLTETTGAVTVNRTDQGEIGTVGQPLPGVSVRVADDGELMARGPQVFSSYWQDPERTSAVFDTAGWLCTGDLGEIDDQGRVRITGRKKDLLVTAGGKNVAPAALEERVRAHPMVCECLVVGDGKPYVAALVTLDRETYATWARDHGKPEDLSRAVSDPELRAEVQSAVDAANESVSQAEAIRKFAVLPAVWSEETGELTPSLKLRRAEVLRQHSAEIGRLYESDV